MNKETESIKIHRHPLSLMLKAANTMDINILQQIRINFPQNSSHTNLPIHIIAHTCKRFVIKSIFLCNIIFGYHSNLQIIAEMHVCLSLFNYFQLPLMTFPPNFEYKKYYLNVKKLWKNYIWIYMLVFGYSERLPKFWMG